VSTRTHEAGYVLDTDPARLDLDTVERWLATESYWAIGRERAVIERSLAGSTAYGIYAPDGTQVGLLRVVTDGATFAWLCDVFIEAAYRGQGLARWAVAAVRDDVLALGVYRIILATADAHGVYAEAGFTPLAEPDRWMQLTTRVIGRPDVPFTAAASA
jgi:GNAT superfamily N-acetyltransferase